MTDQSLFNKEDQSSTQTQNSSVNTNATSSQTDLYADLLKSIKNERGEQKYATLEDAIKGLSHSQEYIPQLKAQLTEREQEIETLRKEKERIANLEEALNQLTQKTTQTQQTTAPDFDPEKIAGIVEQRLALLEQKKAQDTNVALVTEAVKNQFGKDAETVFYTKAAEFGMSQAQVNQLAATNPKAVLTLLGITATPNKTNVSVTTSSVNSSAYQPQPDTVISRNTTKVLYGADTETLNASVERANKMVEELEAKGMSVYDFTDPKQYFKHFRN